MASEPRAMFSSPTTAPLASCYILCRSTLLLTNVIGMGVCFGAGSRTGSATGFVAGSFMAFSFMVQPLFIIWHKRQLRRSRSNTAGQTTTTGYQQLENASSEAPQSPQGLKALTFSMLVDLTGVIAYFILYPFALGETNYYWSALLMAYSSVATLVCAVIHLALFLAQLWQLRTAYCARRPTGMRCPHCNHQMRRLSHDSPVPSSSSQTSHHTDTIQVLGREERQQDLLNDTIADVDPDATAIGMEPGQVTGTCTRTPRVSESARRTESVSDGGETVVAANENGEGESDGLLEKIACDLHASMEGRWWDRVMPQMSQRH